MFRVGDGSGFVAEFRAAQRRRGLSTATIDARCRIVARWIVFVGDPFAGSVSWRDVESFVDAQTGMRAPRTRYAAVSHLGQFYRWAQRVGLCDHDPTALVERPRVPPAAPRPATAADIALAIAAADPPMAAAITLAAYCGLRSVELARLQWVDVDDRAVRVVGKGDRVRVVPMAAPAVDALDELERGDGRAVLPYGVGPDRQPGSRVSHAISRHARRHGLAFTAHQLRHYCATRVYALTGDIGAVQDFLGHASPATTRVYALQAPDRMRWIADRLGEPVDVTPARTEREPGYRPRARAR